MAKRSVARSPEYEAWASMLKRCRNPTSTNYAYYGGRGITVCAEWHSFARFFADVGPRPPGTAVVRARYSLERLNNNLGYVPGNVKWATTFEQHRNRRANVYLTAFGETLILSDWARRTGIHKDVLRYRISHGWSLERMLTQPSQLRRGGRKS